MEPACERELLLLCRDLDQMLAVPPSDSTPVLPERLIQEINKFHTSFAGPLELDSVRPICAEFKLQMETFLAAAKGRCRGLGNCLESSLGNTLTHLCALVIRMIEGICAGVPRDETAHLSAAACEYVTKASQASTDLKVRSTQNFVVTKLLEQIKTMQSAAEDLGKEQETSEIERIKGEVDTRIQVWKRVAAAWLPSSAVQYDINQAEEVILNCEKEADEVDFQASKVRVRQVLSLGENDFIEDSPGDEDL